MFALQLDSKAATANNLNSKRKVHFDDNPKREDVITRYDFSVPSTLVNWK